MEYLKKIIDSHEFKLFGDEEKLYSYLTEDKSDLVLPSLVCSVQKNIYSKDNFQKKVDQTKKSLEKEEKEVKKIFENVRKLFQDHIGKKIESVVPQNFKFSKELHHPSLTLVDDQTVRVTSTVWGTALLEPSLLASNYKSVKIKFKINKSTGSRLLFGVCQLTPNIKITDSDIWNRFKHGSFTCYVQDDIRIGSSQGHRKESNSVTKQETDDIMQVEYWRETERVEVRNVTKGTKSISFIKSDKDLPLYFGVGIYDNNDEVKVIGAEWV